MISFSSKFDCYQFVLILILGCSVSACNSPKVNKQTIDEKRIDIQGHRGCRGWMPENTIPAFIKALQIGVTTLELDLAVTKDLKLVVSHEPWLSHEIMLDPRGNPIAQSDEKSWNIYGMSYDSLCQFDCGSKPHPRFAKQMKLSLTKPKLTDLIDSVNLFLGPERASKIVYNIEIKRKPEYDSVYCPSVHQFVDLVLELIDKKGIKEQCNIQSFDIETLQICKQKAPDIPLALLVENLLSPSENIQKLGFKPDIYSCNFRLINDKLLAWKDSLEIRLIPWTVNEITDIKKVIQWPVDGIISDYPDRVIACINE